MLNNKKIIITILLFVFSFLLVACDKKTEIKKEVDESKAQLYVSNTNTGHGHEWLDKIIARFEADYAEEVFIPGTKGVQVWVTNHKENGASMEPKLFQQREEVYFIENCNLYSYISSGKLLEITDIVTEKLTKYGESESIEDKIRDNQLSYYRTNDGKYYALPHIQSPTSITYDIDLFNKNNLLFDTSGKLTKKNTDEGLSTGPDGKSGTSDDGLPSTYEEFYTLCATMKRRGIAPIVWSGMYPFYMNWFAAQLKADFEGSETHISYSLDGVMTKLVDSIDQNGVVTYKEPTTITKENGYEIFDSAGIYYAVDFIYNLIKNDYYYIKSFNESVSHTDAQALFLLSSFTSEQDIGMLVEGTWWTYESEPTFDAMSSYSGSSLEERHLALLPLPKATADQIGEKSTMLDSLNDLAFISANIDESKIRLAKTFLQYCETNKSLLEFFETTNAIRGYDVDYSSLYDGATSFGKSVIDNVAYANIELGASNTEFFFNNYNVLYHESAIGTTEYPYVSQALKAGKTSIEYFNDIKNKYNENTWAVLLNK